VAAALLLAGAAWHSLAGRFQHPVGSGPAGPAVDAAPFRQAWSKQPVVLLGLGDSVTAGYGAAPGRSYFELLARNDDTLYPDMAGRDLEDPNARGYDVIRRAFLLAMVRELAP